ncbi:hypothetical protein [Halarcobacter ebronensis]|uniref:Uncharacterized protein n=1 Tax=Halarcobacter ebronensis TaxID=1462615 RepID=A0A4Q1AZE7_9BACT|nr:hypothetical protein [Halarcobacter ebronensis]QKF82419.1 hypothetical protein AEBR_1939 [Halarcobacter ebronensis]RXK07558.1 hypothetical protein CRV07_03605 [Halarcobacter ebronensis]
MDDKFSLADVKHIKRITVGDVDPNKPMSDEKKDEQVKRLNEYLNGYPKGKLIGKDVSFAIFQVGEHQLTTQATTYHIGFPREVN